MSEREWDLFTRPTVELCPGCESILGERSCHFYYSTWRCWGCGGTIDSRTGHPKLAMKCENEWPDYRQRLAEPVHPIACSCSGRGWYSIEEASS